MDVVQQALQRYRFILDLVLRLAAYVDRQQKVRRPQLNAVTGKEHDDFVTAPDVVLEAANRVLHAALGQVVFHGHAETDLLQRSAHGLGIGPGVEQLGDVLVAVVAHHQRTPGWALRFFGGVVCRCERWFRLALRCLQLRTQLRHFGHQLGQVLGRLLRLILLLLGFGLQRETRQAQALGLLRQTRLLGNALVLQQTLLRSKLRLLFDQALLLCHCFSLQALLISAAGIGKLLLPRCLRQLVLLTPGLGEPLLIPRPLPSKVLLGKLDLGRRRLQLFEQAGGPLCPRCFPIASGRVDGIVCDGRRGDCNRRRRV